MEETQKEIENGRYTERDRKRDSKKRFFVSRVGHNKLECLLIASISC